MDGIHIDPNKIEAVKNWKALESPTEVRSFLGLADMDLFNLIRASNPTKVKTGTRPRAAHEVPLLTVTASRVIEIEDPAVATDSFGVPATIERSPLDFANENPSQQSTGGNGTEDQSQEAVATEVPPPENVTTTRVDPEAAQAEGIAAAGPHMIKERRKRGNDWSTIGGKSLAVAGLGMGSTCLVPTSRDAPVDVNDPDPLSFTDPQSLSTTYIAQSSKGAATVRDPESENTSFTSMVGSPESIYRPEWGVTNSCLLDAPEACQDLVDHIAPPGYFSKLYHLHNDDFLKQYNINLAQQVAMGSQLRLRENEIKNLKTLLEAETDMKKIAKGKSAELGKELENLRVLFLDLHVSNDRVSQQVSTLQAQVTGEEKLKAAFEEFKQYENNRVEKRCAEIDAHLDTLSIDLTRRLKYEVEHGKANLSLEAIEAYDPEAEAKYIAALHAIKDLKYPMVNQLESEGCTDRCDNGLLTPRE
nr:hypothetical protein [Tanacetum cinerariifolium]